MTFAPTPEKTMTLESGGRLPPERIFGPEVLKLAAAFAVALFVVSSIVWGLAGFDLVASAPGKIVGIAGDAVLALIITLCLWKIRHWRLGYKALVACTLSLALAPVSGLIDWGLHIFFVWPEPAPFDANYFAQVVIFTTSELFGWSCLFLALQYSAQARETERRLAQIREEALVAQMQALQYQVNPHFLFNTLNAVAGLIEENQSRPARDMVLQLARFLRRTLVLDVLSEMRLADEVKLQMDYLEIERVRFSDRMQVVIDVADDVTDALVPSLILQPLIENAVKHGIARTSGTATLWLIANRSDDGRLCIAVENSVPLEKPPAMAGLGIGLANVASRLSGKYGADASCVSSLPSPERARVEILMPLRLP